VVALKMRRPRAVSQDRTREAVGERKPMIDVVARNAARSIGVLER